VTIAKAGKPVARLVPAHAPTERILGLDRGRVTIADDFDTPLPDDLLADFER
jgi:antitoxin (DNA-binding transcriptional repressor) of toxin-antitoxin stability system